MTMLNLCGGCKSSLETITRIFYMSGLYFKAILLKSKPIQLQFYTKPDCTLCDEAKAVLQSIGEKASFIAVEEIDITKDLGLFTKYKHLIPVLELDGQRLFAHHATYWKLVWQLRWHRFRRLLTQIGRRGL